MSKMNKKYKTYLKLNILSLFFIAVSFLSITLAWFAYSGLVTAGAEIDVKAWYIEFQKNGGAVSNEVVISLSDIHPGMTPVLEEINILNQGDSDAGIDYSITSARILEDYLEQDGLEKDALEDKLAHDYPFHINIELDKKYAKAKSGKSALRVSVSWPLDSDNDTLDSKWGSEAFQFQKKEANKLQNDSSYEARPTLKIVLNLKAEQYMESNEDIDTNYNLGDTILYNMKTNQACPKLEGDCIKTTILNVENKIGDTSVLLLPDLFGNYASGPYENYQALLNSVTTGWNVETRTLNVSDLLKPVSTDIVNSILVRENLSDSIIGNLRYNDRTPKELEKVKTKNGYYQFMNQKFPYLSTSKCYWINDEYSPSQGFALIKTDEEHSKIYGEDKNMECSIVPIVEVPKSKLQS